MPPQHHIVLHQKLKWHLWPLPHSKGQLDSYSAEKPYLKLSEQLLSRHGATKPKKWQFSCHRGQTGYFKPRYLQRTHFEVINSLPDMPQRQGKLLKWYKILMLWLLSRMGIWIPLPLYLNWYLLPFLEHSSSWNLYVFTENSLQRVGKLLIVWNYYWLKVTE